MSQCELDKNNIIDFTDEELSPEDCQAMEDFKRVWHGSNFEWSCSTPKL
jgi:hypothetical protein